MLPILLVLAANAPIEPGLPISADSAWAVAPEGPRTYLERVTGKRIDPRTITPIREGDMVFERAFRPNKMHDLFEKVFQPE